MRFFASWWERVRERHVVQAIALVAVVAVVGLHLGQVKPGAVSPALHHLNTSIGELWT